MTDRVIARFERIADTAPSDLAVVVGGERFTFGDLARRADAVALRLDHEGVGPGQFVAVSVTRSGWLIPSLLGVLKLGAAFVPIDPHLPVSRAVSMVNQAAARWILTDQRTPESRQTCQEISGVAINPETVSLGGPPSRPPIPATTPAYLIFTSGSTGNPKGVVVSDANLSWFVDAWADRLELGRGESIASLTTVAFDIFLAETIVPLCCGMSVFLADEDDTASPDAVVRFLERSSVTHLQTTPSRLRWLLSNPRFSRAIASVEKVIVGGESFPTDILGSLRGITDADVYNVYGPTEATIWVSTKLVANANDITIGTPLSGVDLMIDAERSDEGELLIAGPAVASGYLGDDQGGFVSDHRGHRRYRTGDSARRGAAGEVIVAGRIDHQIKIDGYRVELGEIESVLLRTPDVEACAVVALGRDSGSVLVAVVAPVTVDLGQLRTNAEASLPLYMLPSAYRAWEAVPLNPSGKIDRGAVRHAVMRALVDDTAPPLKFLLDAVEAIVGQKVSAATPGLIEIGVGSLRSARIAAEMRTRYDVAVPLAEVVVAPTLGAVAALFTLDG